MTNSVLKLFMPVALGGLLFATVTQVPKVIISYKNWQSRASALRQIPLGKRLAVPVDPIHRPVQIALAIQKGCQWCEASEDFFRAIFSTCTEDNCRITVVLPAAQDGEPSYLASMLPENSHVVHVAFVTLGVTATPTLIYVGSNGNIENRWIGKLDDTQAKEALAILKERLLLAK